MCSCGNRMRCTTRNLPHRPVRRSDTRHGRPLGGHFIPTDGYLVSQAKPFQRIPAASMHLLVKIINFLWAHPHRFKPVHIAIDDVEVPRPQLTSRNRFRNLLWPYHGIGGVALPITINSSEAGVDTAASRRRRLFHQSVLVRHCFYREALQVRLQCGQCGLFRNFALDRFWNGHHFHRHGHRSRLHAHQLGVESSQFLRHDLGIFYKVASRRRHFPNLGRCPRRGFAVVLAFQRPSCFLQPANDIVDFRRQRAPPRIRLRHIPNLRRHQVRSQLHNVRTDIHHRHRKPKWAVPRLRLVHNRHRLNTDIPTCIRDLHSPTIRVLLRLKTSSLPPETVVQPFQLL